MVEFENLRKANERYFPELQKAFAATLESGWYILGKGVERFEREFAAYCGPDHCVGVASGTDALILSLKAFDFPANAEVILPANAYIATVLAVIANGLKPVLVEPDARTCNIDPGRIEEKITDATVGIMVIHLYGKMCDMERISEIAKRRRLRLFEDCAQAHGAAINGKKAGTWGDCAAFSFYPTKNLGGLGDGGAVVTNDPVCAARIRALRNYGSEKRYQSDLRGTNSRLDEMQAAFLSVKLPALDAINRHKRALADRYNHGIDRRFVKPVEQAGYHDVFHIYNIRHPRRDELRKHLADRGIASDIHYPVPPYRQPSIESLFAGERYPISDEMHATTLSLPISVCHCDADVDLVIRAVNEFGH